jgi:MFS transporter, CP family, cyanate transporter
MAVGGLRRPTVYASVAILAAAFNLRIAVVAVGALLDQIRADTGMGATLAGALGAIPFLCMGAFALAGVPLVLHFGARRLIAAALALIVAGTLARSLMPTAGLIVLATIPVGIAIALIGLALPAVIKRSFGMRVGAATGAYVAALSLGAAVAAVTMVPLADALGGWRAAFAVSVIPTVLAWPLWLLLPRQDHAAPSAIASRAVARGGRRSGMPSRRGWLLAAVFGLQSMCYAAVINWIAALYIHAGWSASSAALTTAAVSILSVPGALVIPGLSDGGDRGRWLLGTALTMGAGMLGLALAPTAVAWLWIIVFSIGSGALFPLVLTLPLDLGESDGAVIELTAWMLGFGYFLSATGPLVVGGLYDLTGGFVLPLALLAGFGTLAGVVARAPALRVAQPTGETSIPVTRL